MSSTEIRIAMWSGPRNISTALMRSWDARGDTAVCDEPLYACYLAATGADHPGRERIIEDGETDWARVVAMLTGKIPGGRPIFYQKHMAHHLLPEFGRTWLAALRHALLVRDPREMLASLARVTPHPRLDDTGLPQQCLLYDEVAQREGRAPPVLDAADVLRDPAGQLAALCAALGVPFRRSMLSWRAGPRPTDGVWAEHWYGEVERSTAFRPHGPKNIELPDRLAPLLDECRPYYERLHARRLVTS
ncbi:MAG: HAD family hydrolase [Acidobacteriota bacterium]|nr:HAD family hydrolase [Acidobacteriota bacterium]